MEVRNCKGCGRLFNVLGTEKLCSACRQGLEDKFQEVKKFLDENPNSSVETVSREMDVSTKQIRHWVREERLIFSEGSMEGIECEMCGAMIRTGRYCEKCKAAAIGNLQSAINKPKIEAPQKKRRESEKMRFLQ